MAWGGYKNGQIPLSAMSVVRGEYFNPEAAKYLRALEDKFAAESKEKKQALILQGYRPLGKPSDKTAASQWGAWYVYEHGGNLAAYPGTSNHGFGMACDFGSGIDVFGSAHKKLMDKLAPKYGWHPTGNGFSPREAWHYDFKPGTATVSLTSTTGGSAAKIGDDDMPEEKLKTVTLHEKLVKGKWQYVHLNKKRDVSWIFGRHLVDTKAWFQFSGLPAGREVQIRITRVTVKGGKDTRHDGKITEIIGTGGKTFGMAADLTGMGANDRLRILVAVFDDGVVLDSVTTKLTVFKR